MGASDFLHQLMADRFIVVGEGSRLLVGPRHRVTDEHRERIHHFKDELLDLVPHRHWIVTLPDRIVRFTVPQGMTREEVLQHYPTALDAQPAQCD